MPNILLERFTTSNGQDEFRRWWKDEHVPGANEVPGIGEDVTYFRACSFEGKYWTYRPEPDLTTSYVLSASADVAELEQSEPLAIWAREAVERSRARRVGVQALFAEQIFGQTSSLPYELVLIAAMNVTPEAEQEFNRWYNEDHIPQASEIPGFGTDHRRFRRLPTRIERFGYSTGQKYVAMYEIKGNANVLEAINSDQYRAWSGDFLARWRDLTSDEVSTINERLHLGDL